MNNDINSLSGIEFENLCQTLLQKAGFNLETTKQSGDGGIDLIAKNHHSFVSGKYIVQCKRYSGSVGEPILRDLYGVVMAERANKGILITTGYFTISTIRFASDKNLELIDGERLAELLYEHGLISDNKPAKYNHFTQHECFDTRKYDFYKSMINQNLCTIEMGHDFLFSFMFEYMTSVGSSNDLNEMLHAGFADEYLQLFSWYTGKYYKRGKEQLENLPLYVRKYKGTAQLLNFDLFEYIQSRYTILTKKCEIQLTYHREGNFNRDGSKYYSPCDLSRLHESDLPWYVEMRPEIMANLMDVNRVSLRSQEYSFYELMNLLSIFSYFKIQRGVDLINKLLYGEMPEFKEWIESKAVYQDAINNLQIHYFKIIDTLYGGECFGTESTDESLIILNSYYEMFVTAHQEKIRGEISQIEELLMALS